MIMIADRSNDGRRSISYPPCLRRSERGTGGSPVEGNRPFRPSGRQDLNLRPLDPQQCAAIASVHVSEAAVMACGPKWSQARHGAVKYAARRVVELPALQIYSNNVWTETPIGSKP